MTRYNNFAVRPEAYKKMDEICKVTRRTKVIQFEILVDEEYKRLGLNKEEKKPC